MRAHRFEGMVPEIGFREIAVEMFGSQVLDRHPTHVSEQFDVSAKEVLSPLVALLSEGIGEKISIDVVKMMEGSPRLVEMMLLSPEKRVGLRDGGSIPFEPTFVHQSFEIHRREAATLSTIEEREFEFVSGRDVDEVELALAEFQPQDLSLLGIRGGFVKELVTDKVLGESARYLPKGRGSLPFFIGQITSNPHVEGMTKLMSQDQCIEGVAGVTDHCPRNF